MSPEQNNKGSVKPQPQSQGLVGQTALERLRRIQDSRMTFWRELGENWSGWLFSAVFHAGLLALSLLIVVAVPEVVKQFTLETGYDDSLMKLTEDPLDDIFKESPVDSDIDELPSVEADRDDVTPGYTELDPGAPDYMTMGGHLTGLGHGGGGGDHLAGVAWGGYIRKLRKTGLDVVFVFDSTGSMGEIILETKTRIRQLMKVVTYLVPDARLGLVTYRDLKKFDLDDYEYTTKGTSLTKDVKPLERFLRNVQAYGGGDIPEAVKEALDAAMHANWNQGAKRVIILFGDAPPRPENDGINKVYDMCERWHKRTGGLISVIDTTGQDKLMEEFKQIAVAGGGQATSLANERDIIRQLVVHIFGSKWKDQIDKVYNSVLKGPKDIHIIEDD